MTTTEDKLQVGDVFRPRPSKNNGFMTMVVIRIENGLATVKRPFCYGKDRDYETGTETFSFWLNSSFEVDILERR